MDSVVILEALTPVCIIILQHSNDIADNDVYRMLVSILPRETSVFIERNRCT